MFRRIGRRLLRSFSLSLTARSFRDDAHAPGIEIGRRGPKLSGEFGFLRPSALTVFVTDGHLPYPYGREMTGYEVANLAETLAKAKAAGVTVLAEPYSAGGPDGRRWCSFPGGYIAEIHSLDGK